MNKVNLLNEVRVVKTNKVYSWIQGFLNLKFYIMNVAYVWGNLKSVVVCVHGREDVSRSPFVLTQYSMLNLFQSVVLSTNIVIELLFSWL